MRAQKGHKGCTSAGTDARVGSTVRMRVRHVIDRGRSAQWCQEVSPTQDGNKGRREEVCGTVDREKGRIDEKKIVSKTYSHNMYQYQAIACEVPCDRYTPNSFTCEPSILRLIA